MGLGSFPRSPPASFSPVEVSGRSHLGPPNVPEQGSYKGQSVRGVPVWQPGDSRASEQGRPGDCVPRFPLHLTTPHPAQALPCHRLKLSLKETRHNVGSGGCSSSGKFHPFWGAQVAWSAALERRGPGGDGRGTVWVCT